jgi:plastocyanin
MAAVALLGASACGGDDAAPVATEPARPASTGEQAPASEAFTIAVLDNEYLPAEAVVRAGQPVVWVNEGNNPHDVIPAEGDAWGVEIEDLPPGGGRYEHVFDTPGTYAYYCTIHGTKKGNGMAGTVVVEA